jgi:hypothetical protein
MQPINNEKACRSGLLATSVSAGAQPPRRRVAARPKSARPARAIEPGSGTAFGLLGVSVVV